MKHLITILTFTIGITSCMSPEGSNKEYTNKGYVIKTIDSCEYIECDYGIFDQRVYSLTHKGNCKFCKLRLAAQTKTKY